MIDEIDRQILSLVQGDARVNNAEVARRVGMAPSATLERLRKLEKRGVIRGYEARIDAAAVGLGLLAFVFVKTNETLAEMSTDRALAALPEVQEVHHVAGEDCYLVKIRAASPAALGRLLREKLGAIPTVHSTRSTVVLETVKECACFPLEAVDPCAADSGDGDA